MAVTNEVLAERIDSYSKQSLLEAQQFRKDLTSVLDAIGRLTDQVMRVDERVNTHEQLPGHVVEMMRIGQLEKRDETHSKDIEELRKILNLERDVTQLKVEVEQVKSAQKEQQSFKQGRESAFSTGEKLFFMLIAASGPLLLISERL